MKKALISNMWLKTCLNKNYGGFLLLVVYVSGYFISQSSAFNNAGPTASFSQRMTPSVFPSRVSSFRNAPISLHTRNISVQFDEKVSRDIMGV